MFHPIISDDSSKKKQPKAIPVTLSTRIRLARNLQKFPFLGVPKCHKNAVLSECISAVSGIKSLDNSVSIEVDDLSELDRTDPS